MTMIRIAFLALPLPTIASPPGRGLEGTAQFGTIFVKFGAAAALKDRVPDDLPPSVHLQLQRTTAVKRRNRGRPADREAAILGRTVSDLREWVFTGEVYKGANGRLRICALGAIQRRTCGSRLGLSIDQGVAIAERLLSMSERCRRVGFDESYNRQALFSAGASEFMLHVPSDCG